MTPVEKCLDSSEQRLLVESIISRTQTRLSENIQAPFLEIKQNMLHEQRVQHLMLEMQNEELWMVKRDETPFCVQDIGMDDYSANPTSSDLHTLRGGLLC